MEKDFQTQENGFQPDAESHREQSELTSQQLSSDQPQRTPRKRVRIQRPAQRENYGDEQNSFRPEGFGQSLGRQEQDGYQQRPYRPRYNQQEGGYQPRQQGYQPRYNKYQQQDGEGYQPRQGGYQQRQGGYQPRYNRYNQQEGEGYQQRQGNYQPRYNRYNQQDGEGYQPRQEGYQPRYNKYQQQGDGGYQPRQQGYRPRYNQQEGEGSYQPRRPQQFQPRQGFQRNSQQQRSFRPQGFRQRTSDYDPNAKYSMKKRIEYKEENYDPMEPIRLNKFLANAGICSRREADEYIESGAIKVNGEVVTELGTKVLRTDEILFNDTPVSLEKKVYVLLNKPKDYVTTSDDPQQRKTVMDLVKDACPERIYPVGRLDRNTTGVLLLTNDGDLASKLTHPKFLKKKIYHVYLDKPITAFDMQKIAEGIELEDGEIHADAIDYADDRDKTQVGIEIHSGKNRIVRRIFESLGYHVVKLDRVQFAGLTKKNLRRGDWRFLTEKEVDMLRMGAFE